MRLPRLLHRLLIGREIWAKQLLQIRREWSFPGDRENFSFPRKVFPNNGSGWQLNLMNRIGLRRSDSHCALHVSDIGLHGSGVATQDGKRVSTDQ